MDATSVQSPSPSQRRRLPRFSLLTALLITTIIAMAIIIALFWREIGPLRAEVRQMRSQLGRLSIDDPSRAKAILVRQPDPNMWRWRIYLPPGGQYKLMECGGKLPARKNMLDEEWLQVVKNTQAGVGRGEFSGKVLDGEFTLEATLHPEGKGWKFETHPGGGKTVYYFDGDWLNNHLVERTAVGHETQREFDPGDPIMLLYLPKPVTTPTTGGGTKYDVPTGEADGIVLWIEQIPPGQSSAK